MLKRSVIAAVTVMAGAGLAPPAAAQGVPQNGRWVTMPGRGTPPPGARPDRARWGGQVHGRWSGGARAPGGWDAYRRPHRGWHLPPYWIAPDFRIPDYLAWGLAAPPYGYSWVRYYDDAVLIDGDGQVWDWVDGIDWGGGATRSYAWSESRASVGSAGADGRYGAGYPVPPQGNPIPTVDPDAYYYDDADTSGGGYVPPVVHWAPSAAQVQPIPQPYTTPAPYPAPAPARACVSACGAHYGGGYYYAAPSTTVIVVQSAPVVTTTTTVVEEEVTTTTRYTPATRTVRRARPSVRVIQTKP